MVEELVVGGELDHLRIDEDEFQFGGVLAVQQRRHDHVQADGLALLRRTCDEEVRCVGEVEDLDLLGDGIADRDRQVGFAFPEGGIVEQGLQGDDRGLVVGHFDADGIRQGHDADAPCIEGHRDILLQALDRRDLHAGGGIDFVKGHGGADNGLDILDLDLVVRDI